MMLIAETYNLASKHSKIITLQTTAHCHGLGMVFPNLVVMVRLSKLRCRSLAPSSPPPVAGWREEFSICFLEGYAGQ